MSPGDGSGFTHRQQRTAHVRSMAQGDHAGIRPESGFQNLRPEKPLRRAGHHREVARPALLPRGTLVTLPTAGHSILDTREQAALRVAAAVCAGETAALATAGANLDALPANPGVRVLRTALWAGASVLPGRRGRSRVPGPTS